MSCAEEPDAEDVNNVESQLKELKEATNGYYQNGAAEANGHAAKSKGHIVANGNGHVKDHSHLNGMQKPVGKDMQNTLPFYLLPGELLEYQTCGNEANLYLTNYRLFVGGGQYFFNVPIRAIEYVELRDLHGLHVHCKDGKVMRIAFDTPEECSEWWRLITSNEASYTKIDDLFAFQYFKCSKSKKSNGLSTQIKQPIECEASTYVNEIKRLGFNTKSIWRTTEINSKFDVCETYPKFHIVPSWITDDDLGTIAHFRALRRFPSVVWRNQDNGAVITRASQPEIGWFGWRCQQDEGLLSAIAQAAKLDIGKNENHNMSASVNVNAVNSSPSFLLVDARSYAAAVANRAKGGGCECQEYYPNCEIQFMSLPNIHAIRKSFQSVRALCLLGQEQSNWFSALEATRWLQNLSLLIRSSLTIVEAIDTEARSVLVHCSDGWDRTPQLVSLAQLLLDPYYRTIKGFRILVEREWLDFGHKFADRCGHSTDKDINERSPVFFQWLDAVHQIMKQFPSSFEFNEFFLMKLLEHSYSCLFGSFLCNSMRDRQKQKIQARTQSVWDFLLSGRKDLVNYLYGTSNGKKILHPSYHVRRLTLWENVFLVSNNTLNDINILTDIVSSVDLTDSGNFNFHSNSLYGHKLPSKTYRKYSRENSYHKTLQTANSVLTDSVEYTITKKESECPSTLVKPSEIECNDNNKNDKLSNGISNGSSTELETINNSISSCNNSKEQLVTNGNHDGGTRSDCDTDTIGSNNPCDCNGNSSNETIKTVSKSNENVSMTDSVRTITGEASNEHRKSVDDLCVGLSSGIDPSLAALDHRTNSMRRTHSSPDSPTMNRLTRTKSVPDVMASSVCVNTDVAKQYPSLEGGNKQLFTDYRPYIDQDGLTLSYNFLDQKLIEIELRHSQELAKLQKKLDLERQARLYLQQQQQFRDGFTYSPTMFSDGLQDDMLSLPDSVNGERSSVSSISNDEGWEQVQFDDVVPTRWLPDHLSSNCVNCGFLFSIMYRKHHCRKCGGVFCDPCTSQKICVPEEQLYIPVRVCAKCYDSLSHQKL